MRHGIDLKTHSQCQGGGQIPPNRNWPEPIAEADVFVTGVLFAWWSLSGSNR
jgi:hypothetical protein